MGTWLDVSIDGWLRLLGFALVAHGAILVWAAGQQRIASWAMLNIAVIAPYPLFMIALVVTGVVGRTLGQGLVVVDGVAVGLLAVAQWSGLRAESATTSPATA